MPRARSTATQGQQVSPIGQSGSVIWPTDINRGQFNAMNRLGQTLGRFGNLATDIGVRMTLAEIEGEVMNAQSITNDMLLDQERLMLTEGDEVLGVKNGQPITKYGEEWKTRFDEIKKLPKGFIYPASRRRFNKWTADHKRLWELKVESKVQEHRASKISADSDKLGDMIATRFDVEDEAIQTGKTDLEVRQSRLEALAQQNIEFNVWTPEQAQGFVDSKMKLARTAHSTAVENEVLGGALTIRNEEGEVDIAQAHKFIDSEPELTTEEKIDTKRKLAGAIAQDDAANFQIWSKVEGEKRDEWYDELRDGKYAELQVDLDSFDSGLKGKWKTREVGLKSEFQAILDRRLAAEAASQQKLQELTDPFNREIFGEISEARSQADLDDTARKVAAYVKNRNISVAEGRQQQTEIDQRRTDLATTASDWEAASKLEDRVYSIWTGAEDAAAVQIDLKAARASDVDGQQISEGTYDRLFTLSQTQGKAYQGDAMKEADKYMDGQLVTVSTSVIDSLIGALAAATGDEEINIEEQLGARRDERKLQLWNASRARKALSGWLSENPTADAVAVDNQSRRITALFDKDIVDLQREAVDERQAFLAERQRAVRERTAREVSGGQSALTGELGTLRNAAGDAHTEISATVTDPRLNNGQPTNIPILVKGQIDVESLLAGTPRTRQQEEIAIKRAAARQKAGQDLPSFNTIDEAVSAARARSAQEGRRVGADLPRLTTQGEVDALDDGVDFLWTDGKIYRK